MMQRDLAACRAIAFLRFVCRTMNCEVILSFSLHSFHSHQMNVDGEAFERIRQQYRRCVHRRRVGIGQDSSGFMGEHLIGVFPVLEFLERAKKNGLRGGVGKRVVIIGGGNVSLDAAATAKHLGAKEVMLVYRRSENEMKVWKSELEEAKKLGVQMQFLTQSC